MYAPIYVWVSMFYETSPQCHLGNLFNDFWVVNAFFLYACVLSVESIQQAPSYIIYIIWGLSFLSSRKLVPFFVLF